MTKNGLQVEGLIAENCKLKRIKTLVSDCTSWECRHATVPYRKKWVELSSTECGAGGRIRACNTESYLKEYGSQLVNTLESI